VPDWTYHPFFKPALFRLPAEPARALTLKLLQIQGATAPGRRLFRLFAPKPPPERRAVTVFGLRFPSPVGLAPGIDTHATAIGLLQHLGLGFVEVGPVERDERPRRFDADPLRIEDRRALVQSDRAAAPSARAIAERVRATKELKIPIGVSLGPRHIAEAIAAAEEGASFFTLPASCADEEGLLASLRAATRKPILIRISPDWDDDRLDAAVDAAIAAKIDGCVAVTGAASPLLPGGEMDGPFLLARALAVIARVVARAGDRLPVIGSGGVETPEDALKVIAAGARLVEVHAGIVYAGPGFPARILAALDAPRAGPEPLTPAPAPAPVAERDVGASMVLGTGLILIASGIVALILAATVKLLPHDERFLQMTGADLCDRDACRIVHFMAHDRVSFGGSMISIGTLYSWLAASPLKRGEAWAFWVLVLSGAVGFGSFMTYLGYGYLDVWHGRATLALIPFFTLGMIRAYTRLRGPRGIAELFRIQAPAWRWSPAGMGRIALSFTAFGMIAGGLIVMTVGMTHVFVPQDLEFMQVTVAGLHELNPRLIPLIAHDRAGFGGGICSTGIAVMALVWRGTRPGDKGLWWALLASGLVGFMSAIGIHPIVGYTSFTHLAPAYAGAWMFLTGMWLLYKPMCRVDSGAVSGRFPDL
jgi:dihydroorotate dehydrogenase